MYFLRFVLSIMISLHMLIFYQAIINTYTCKGSWACRYDSCRKGNYSLMCYNIKFLFLIFIRQERVGKIVVGKIKICQKVFVI